MYNSLFGNHLSVLSGRESWLEFYEASVKGEVLCAHFFVICYLLFVICYCLETISVLGGGRESWLEFYEASVKGEVEPYGEG